MPDRPTADECAAVHRALVDCHGKPPAPENMQFEDDEEGGPVTDNGKVSSVLDSVFRCMLTLNTNARNYRVGKRGLDERFGRANYEAIRKAPLEDVVEALRPGGLANVKGKRLKQMLNDVYARNGQNKLSLEDLHGLSAPEAKASLLALHGVGPKVAACVMAYRLGLHEFAVDTHVLRITKRLGWVLQKSDSKQAYEHLNAKIPDELKHDLHVLFIQHGRACRTCAAAAVKVKEPIEQCPLRPFFNQ
ncbi:endonuclease III domain-containing protein [Rhodotorula paludigena]|uniref:endonuclease III domain-containing protein n=1 Tax=Rhodotorula paludigena TaxID=86838 RepID=UPI00316BD2F6